MNHVFKLYFHKYTLNQVDRLINRDGTSSYAKNNSFVVTDWVAKGSLTTDQALWVVNQLLVQVSTKYMVEADADTIMAKAYGNITQAAKYLKINRGTLRTYLKDSDPSNVLVVNGATYCKKLTRGTNGGRPKTKEPK